MLELAYSSEQIPFCIKPAKARLAAFKDCSSSFAQKPRFCARLRIQI